MKVKRSTDLNHKLPAGKTLEEYPYALSSEVFHTKQLFLYSEKVLPGKRASAPHNHRSIDEIAVVTKGELVAHEGEMTTHLLPGDAICFASGTDDFHYLENRGDKEAEFLLFRRSTKKDDTVYE